MLALFNDKGRNSDPIFHSEFVYFLPSNSMVSKELHIVIEMQTFE